MYDLLADPLIGTRTVRGETQFSLPEVLAALSGGEIDAYTGQRAHQSDPWRVFTVQLAASILARHPEVSPDSPPAEAAFWREGLLELAEGEASAWHLIVEDPVRPAFLQHPLKDPQELQTDFRPGQPKARTPDELDVLVASKNHDLKMARASALGPEAWVLAVLMYQTTSGFLGQGNYGIVRMNSGTGSRPVVATVASLHPSKRFREELARVCAMRRALLGGALDYRDRGPVLTWIRTWDRIDHQWLRTELDPWFIEACRPLRLIHADGTIVALGATSQARQIGPKEPDSGDIGDPWIPINVGDKKKGQSALTVGARGFTPALLTSILFERGYKLTDLQKIPAGNGDLWLTASVLARGQGSTEGFHRIELPIPAHARPSLSAPHSRETLARAASSLLKDADTLHNALRIALTVLAEGGPSQADFKADSVKAWVQSATQPLEARWRDAYFPYLWRVVDEPVDSIIVRWREHLLEVGRDLLERAAARLPHPSNRSWRARVRAHSAFTAALGKQGWNLTTGSNTTETAA